MLRWKNLILACEIQNPRFFEIESRARVENKADGNVLRDISENNPRQTETAFRAKEFNHYFLFDTRRKGK